MNVKCVIFNFNLGFETDIIFNKLITDGFNVENIIVVDNGSSENLKSKYTNFSIPTNCRFSGQANLALRYLMNYNSDEYYLLITTSAILLEDINYYKEINNLINNNNNIGFIASSLIGGRTNESSPLQNRDNMESELTDIYMYQPIAILVSHDLLSLCVEKNASYFNLDLIRGWGIDRELKYISDRNGLKTLISKSFCVEWATNLTHTKGVADESQKEYWYHANNEMQNTMKKKYGIFWNEKFKSSHYCKKVNYIHMVSLIVKKMFYNC